MNSTHTTPWGARYRWPIVGLASGILIAALIVWGANRDSKTGKLIDKRLADLRAAGEPIDAPVLARMYPVPELDAAVLLRDALPFLRNNPAPGSSPIISGGAEFNHIRPIDAQTLATLRWHYDATTNIVEIMPVLPRGARFGENWSNGVPQAPPINFITVRTATQMLATRALCAAEIGDAEGATAMLERGFRFTAAVPSESTLVSHMIHQACLGLICQITERCLNKVVFTDAQLTRVLDAMPLPSTNNLLGTFRVEHCMMVWAFSEMRRGKHLDDLSPPAMARPWWERAWKRWRWRRDYSDEDFLAYLDLIPQLVETTRMPPRQSINECARLVGGFRSNATSEIASWVTPNWGKALEAHYKIEAQVEVTRAALHVERFRRTRPQVASQLERFRATSGKTPQSFASLPALAADPFDGQPLRFKSLARGYVLYSIGPDGRDDGGLFRPNGTSQTNYDITVTVER